MMNKTINQAEPYSAPRLKAFALSMQRCIAISPSGENPGGTIEDFGDPIVE